MLPCRFYKRDRRRGKGNAREMTARRMDTNVFRCMRYNVGVRVFTADTALLDLPPGHRFPAHKYGLLRRRIVESGVLDERELLPAPPATRDELLIAHTAEYVDAMLSGSIDAHRMRRIGLPWSVELVARARVSVGAQLCAARAALEDGVAGSLSGGTHHARADEGAGYCVFNDIAVAARMLLDGGRVARVAVVDLDVHQGDGTASILGGDRRAYLLSVHGAKNFPFRKVAGTVDVELADGTEDAAYLRALDDVLPGVLAFAPEIVFFQAGVDPLREDVLGRLALSHEGLMARDRRVLAACRARGVPVVLSLGGGYARPIEASVEAYVNTYRVVREVFGG
jgi:acetoin utilization deacetylase AcuC-like enzyme